jgi:hypothetical protein
MSNSKFPRWFVPLCPESATYKGLRFDSDISGVWLELDGSTKPINNPIMLDLAIAFQRELTEDEAREIFGKGKYEECK